MSASHEGADASAAPAPDTFVRHDEHMPELTLQAVVLGAVLGIIFGASSLYLFLKVGMTVSASIPVAVISITLFRWASRALKFRKATILENNIVQTTGSAGESIAFGVGATMPALLILGYEMDALRVMMVAVLGGLLGILMMIPLRRAFIVKQHGVLPYPEGTACAKVLIAGERGGATAATVFGGFGLAFLYQVAMQAMKFWAEYPQRAIAGISGYKGAVLTLEASPTLLGVGYIIGTRTSCIMVGGGLLASLVLTPAIYFFGDTAPAALPPGTKPISQMTTAEVFGGYVRYIGAGAVAAGGIISLVRALPLIIASIVGGLRDLKNTAAGVMTRRTERDMPISVVLVGSLALVAVIAFSHLIPTDISGRVLGAVMIVLFGFLFVTVSSRLTGEIGSSSNPISGMTIATLLLTCLIFWLLGWVSPEYRVTALSVAAIVCIASSNGGTTSQDLKTGHLIGATPIYQQYAIIVGALTSALVIGFTLIFLNNVNTVVSAKPENLPTIKADVSTLSQTEVGPDGQTYKVWWVTAPDQGVDPGRYLVDDTGQAHYLSDPAINGRLTAKDDGTEVVRFSPPQPSLFAVIINGIMSEKLPWGLVLIGACLAVVMQLAGVSSLTFAVGVYLPLSTTTPIFVGGLVRWLVDSIRRTPPEESDTSPAILFSSGLIAGGSLAGILIAALAIMPTLQKTLNMSERLPTGWSEAPLYGVLAFSVLIAALLAVGLRAKGIDEKSKGSQDPLSA